MNLYILIAIVIAGAVTACVICGCSGSLKYEHGTTTAELDWSTPATQPARPPTTRPEPVVSESTAPIDAP